MSAETVEDLISTWTVDPSKNGQYADGRVCDNVGTMHADLTKTRQILFNLLANAAKFTSDGAVSLHVARTTRAGGNDIGVHMVHRYRESG